MPAQVQQILLKKQVMEEKILISGPFGGRAHEKEAIEEIIEDFNQSQDEIHVNYKYQPWGIFGPNLYLQ